MTRLSVFFCFCVFSMATILGSNKAASEEFFLSISAEELGPDAVKMEISTNMPLPIEVMVSINLTNQKPKATWIGTNARIQLRESITIYILDTSKAQLPSGNFYAEVSFYQRWGALKGNPAASNISDVSATSLITLKGTGISTSDRIRQDELQNWVMDNVFMDSPWNVQEYTRRLGDYEKLPAEMNLHSAYYFKNADMTLLVNEFLGTITVWRIGKATR